MRTVIITCAQCGAKRERPAKEIARQQREGRTEFYCSLSCAVSARAKPAAVFSKVCAWCGDNFETENKDGRFCSRPCAALGSRTEAFYAAARQSGKRNSNSNFTLETIAKGLRNREWPRYAGLDAELTDRRIAHTFEYPLTELGYIVDLMLHDSNTVVEFDEYYHSGRQIPADELRTARLRDAGYRVVRVRLKPRQAVYLPTQVPI